MKAFIISLLTFASFAAQASFLDGLHGDLKISGENCKYDNYEMTSHAYGERTDSGLSIFIEETTAGLRIESSIYFFEGKGDKRKTEMEGDIIPLPVTHRTVWETNEQTRTSVHKAYEGVGIALPSLHYEIKQLEENLYVWTDYRGNVQCYLSRVNQ